MKIIYLIISELILILLSSCDQTVSNVELPYKEQLVIRAVLKTGEKVNEFHISRTLHPLDNYSEEKALVKDAVVSISDGTKDYPLTFQGKFYVNDDLVIESGKTYFMTAEWNNKKATARTTIPEPIEIEEITYHKQFYDYSYYKDTMYIVSATFTPKSKTVYKTGYHEVDRPNYLRINYDVFTFNQRNADGKVKAQIFSLSQFSIDEKEVQDYIRKHTYYLYAFDEPYLKYHNTSHQGESDNSIFGSEGLNIIWNVEGDGIGLFIGMTLTTFRF